MTAEFEDFSLAVGRLYRDMQRLQRMEMEKYGLKGIHAECLLAILGSPEGVTGARLSRLCGKDKAAISRTVADLERQGMLERSGSRYRAPLRLTEAGRAAALAIRQKELQSVEQAGQGLTRESRENCYAVTALLARNLHALCAEEIR